MALVCWALVPLTGALLVTGPFSTLGADELPSVRRYGEAATPAGHVLGAWLEGDRLVLVQALPEATDRVVVRAQRVASSLHPRRGVSTAFSVSLRLTEEEQEWSTDDIDVALCRSIMGAGRLWLLLRRRGAPTARAVSVELGTGAERQVPVRALGSVPQPSCVGDLRHRLATRPAQGGAVLFYRCAEPGANEAPHSVLHVTVARSGQIDLRAFQVRGRVLDARWCGRATAIVLVAGRSTQLLSCNLETGKRETVWEHPTEALCGAIQAEGKSLLLYDGHSWRKWSVHAGNWHLDWARTLPGPESRESELRIGGRLAVWLDRVTTRLPLLHEVRDLSTVAAIDSESGAMLWQVDLPEVDGLVGIGPDCVVARTERGVALLSPRTGELVGRGAHFGIPLAVAASQACLVTAERGLVRVWSRSDGRLIRSLLGVRWWGVDHPAGAVWCGTRSVLYRIDLRTGQVTHQPAAGRGLHERLYREVPVHDGQALVFRRDPGSRLRLWGTWKPLDPQAGPRQGTFSVTGFREHEIIALYMTAMVDNDTVAFLSGHFDDALVSVARIGNDSRIWEIPSMGWATWLDASGKMLALGTKGSGLAMDSAHYEVWDTASRMPVAYGGFRTSPVSLSAVDISPDRRHLVWSTRMERGGWVYDVYGIADAERCHGWADRDPQAGPAQFVSNRCVARGLADGTIETRTFNCDRHGPVDRSHLLPVEPQGKVRWVLYAASTYDRPASSVSLPVAVRNTLDYLRSSTVHTTLTFPVDTRPPLQTMANAIRRFGRPNEIHVIGPMLQNDPDEAPKVVLSRAALPNCGAAMLGTLVAAFGASEGTVFLWSPWAAERIDPRKDAYYRGLADAVNWSVYALEGDLPVRPDTYEPKWVPVKVHEANNR